MMALQRGSYVKVGWLAGIGLVSLCFGFACGGSTKPPETGSEAAASSATASAPLFTQSSGASPLHLAWKVASCDVELRDGLGATYRFEEGQRERVQGALRKASDACLDVAQGTQGTIYVEAKVGGGGILSDVVISPGGAVSTEVAGCMKRSFEGVVLAPPKEPESVLLLFFVSACPPP